MGVLQKYFISHLCEYGYGIIIVIWGGVGVLDRKCLSNKLRKQIATFMQEGDQTLLTSLIQQR